MVNGNNGTSPTAQTIDGITIDLNRVSRLTFREFLRQLTEVGENGGDDLTGDFIERVVTAWPFGTDITKDAYLNLGLLDSARVDAALNEAMEIISKKKSSSLPKQPESLTAP